MSDTLSLSEEFQASALAYNGKADSVTLPMLLTKYAVLQRHQLTDPLEKDSIAATLFGCGLEMMQAVARKGPARLYIDDDMPNAIGSIFSLLLEPESANNLPSRAPTMLAQVTLELLRNAEAAQDSDFLDHDKRPDYSAYCEYRSKVPQLAALALSFADKFKTAIEKSNANVTTGGPVTTSKPLQLKTTGQPV
jgi:hypothetical protein